MKKFQQDAFACSEPVRAGRASYWIKQICGLVQCRKKVELGALCLWSTHAAVDTTLIQTFVCYVYFEKNEEKFLRWHEKLSSAEARRKSSLGLAVQGGRTQVVLFDGKSATHACETFSV